VGRDAPGASSERAHKSPPGGERRRLLSSRSTQLTLARSRQSEGGRGCGVFLSKGGVCRDLRTGGRAGRLLFFDSVCTSCGRCGAVRCGAAEGTRRLAEGGEPATDHRPSQIDLVVPLSSALPAPPRPAPQLLTGGRACVRAVQRSLNYARAGRAGGRRCVLRAEQQATTRVTVHVLSF
jgi:hypothetical protein